MIKTGPRLLLGPVCLSLLALAPLAASAQTLQEVLLRAKPAAVLVASEVSAEATVDCEGQQVTGKAAPLRETGTGWVVHPSGWIVTAAHVVASSQQASPAVDAMLRDNAVKASCLRLVLARRGLSAGVRPDVEEEIARQLTARVVPTARVRVDRVVAVILPNGRRLVSRVAKYAAPAAGAAMSGRDLALLKVEAENLPTLPLADSSKVKIGDRLHIIGFPSVVMTHELLSTSQLDASVTGGAISGFKEDVSGQPVIQTDAAAAGGDSGGPAVNEQGGVVGVMTFVSKAGGESGGIVQGFNFIVPASAVRDFLKNTDVTPGDQGAFTRAWASGLEAFFSADYTGARPHLAEASRLLPNLPDVRRMIQENDERIKNPPPRPFPWQRVGMTLTIVGVLGCVISWGDWWKRNRFRVRPRDIARLLDSGESGVVLLDVRDSDTFRKSPVRIRRALHVPAERLAAGETSLPIESDRPVVAYCT
ncbi:MAG: trypsin-like serine protease [Candidatus Rokubacteria bacterium]|nr:trypsin-like serine protease [Candidatus Rokubacteria bacterium]